MEVIAETKSVRISPRKVRLVADAISNMPIDRALAVLAVTKKRASYALIKTLRSALANAQHNNKIEAGDLQLKSIVVSEGQAIKRYHPSTRGRIHPYKKRSSHIRVILAERGKSVK